MLLKPLLHKNTLLGLMSLLLISVAEAADVKEVRLWRAPDYTRVVLDLTKGVEHKVIALSNPDRIVIDIKDTRLKHKLSSVDLQHSPVKRLRSAIKDKKDLRIVLDVSTPVKPRSFLLKANGKYSDRLVIDLYEKQTKKKVAIKSVSNEKKRDIVIAIDAGHGGEDPGASGPNKLREKYVVLAIAKELKALLSKKTGYKPVMIRKGDYYVGLKKRRQLARKAQADLLISIHADAFKDPRARGTSVYALSHRGATSAAAKFLADEANSADLVGGVNLGDKDALLAGVLADLSMTASLDASLNVGGNVVREMDRVSHLHSRRVEQAAFAVLKSPDIPSILVETGFISNPQEAKKLKTPAYQKKIAKALFTGVNRYFETNPPPDTYLAWQKDLRRKRTEYVIARGDTLSGIAKRYKVSVASIRQHNDLSSSVIKVGQKIAIPSL